MTDFSVSSLRALFDEHQKRTLADFFRFLQFASVSTDPQYKTDILACSSWLADYLKKSGLSVETWETPGYPVIYAEWLGAGPNKPTVVLYGHYDVQPVDPIELWESPPFEPTVRDGEVYARGAVDNKGQCFYFISLIKTLLERDKKLPLNIKIVIEGEEETGSGGLAHILPERAKELSCDHVVIVDVGIHDMSEPSVTIGVRGICALEVIVTGSHVDLHSGTFGGVVYNPNRALVEMLAKLWDDQGKILVPGFYDDVTQLKPEMRNAIDFSIDLSNHERALGFKAIGGERSFSAIESGWIRPTLELNGVSGGYAGPGFKTVIPAKAIAKISCRLVPNQEPEKIVPLVSEYLKKLCPTGLDVEVVVRQGRGSPLWTDPNSPVVNAAARAVSDVFGKPCKKILEGASIPIVADFAQVTKGDVVLLGYILPGDQLHAPNEHFGLDRFKLGFVTIGRMLAILAEQ